AVSRWADLTGQYQPWRLFAPDLAEVVPFLLVEARWAGEPPRRAWLDSPNRPANRHRFLRLGLFRTRRAATLLDLAPPPSMTRSFDPHSQRWADYLRGRLRDERVGLLLYLRWRVDTYRRQHPGVGCPDEVLLHLQLYRIPPPPGPSPWDWEDWGLRP